MIDEPIQKGNPMSIVGKSEIRVDAFDKATGRTKYYEDRMPAGALYARIKHAEKAHAFVKSIDTSAACAIDGVVKVLTCFEVPDIPFPTAGHPWSMDPDHQDVADRLLLNRHVRYYGDDIAVVIAENEVAAVQGVRALVVEYEELPFVLDVQKAMEEGAPQLHEEYPGNILKHTSMQKGDYARAIAEEGLVKVEGWYDTPTVQHCHIENFGCFAYAENGRMVVVTSTQIPHIVRRVVGQALGRPWADIEIIKPYIGGGFGNKQDVLYEPLCAWCSEKVGGRCVRIDCTREETFVSNRVRHAIRYHIVTWVRENGVIAARKMECFSNQGAYASHGHSIAAKGMGSFGQHYPCENLELDSWTVFTNKPSAGAMRGYGMPQASFADESNIEDCAAAVGMDSYEFRKLNVMPKGFHDAFSGNTNYYDSFRECMSKAAEYIDYDRDDEVSSIVQAYNRMVTELSESSRKLAQAERDKAWSGMARQVAHEIKNPLTPMKLQLQRVIRLKEKGDPAWETRFEEASQVILDHIDILTDTANEFSTFAKLYTEEPTTIALDKLLHEEISMFDNRENIHFDYLGLSGVKIRGPKPQLTRVFVNLLGNAVQAIGDAPDGRIVVSLRKSVEDGFWDIVVEDNGPGVSDENVEKLFTPNFTTKNGGSGLGLAISRSILERCGASISYSKSFTLGGACFTVRYPANPAAQE